MRRALGPLILANLAWLLPAAPPLAAAPPPEPSPADWVQVLVTHAGSLEDRDLLNEATAQIAAAGKPAVPALVEALGKAKTAAQVFQLCKTLWMPSIRRDGQAAVPLLKRLLDEAPAEARPAVAAALARIDAEAGRAGLPLLEACVADRAQRLDLRLGCVLGLESLGHGAGAAALVGALDHHSAAFRTAVVLALESAPHEVVRAPLQRLLEDPDPGVRLTAAGRLVEVVPPVTGALDRLVRDVCRVEDSLASHAVSGLRPRELSSFAREAIAAELRFADPRCRQWMAILLARLDHERGVRSLPALREALRSDTEHLRWEAVWALGAMGCAATSALPDLRAAAKAEPWLTRAVEQVENSQGPCRIDDVSLFATADTAKVPVALLLTPLGKIVGGVAGGAFRFVDGEIERIEPGAVVVVARRVADDLSLVPERRRLELFQKRRPESVPGSAGDDDLLDIDFQEDVATFARFSNMLAGTDVILAPGTTGNVHLVARRAPLRPALQHGLESSGFSTEPFGDFLVVSKGKNRMSLRPPIAAPATEPISMTLIDAAMADIARSFERLSGLTIVLPPGPHAPVTVFAANVPWWELLDALFASRGWSGRLEGERIVVTASGPK